MPAVEGALFISSEPTPVHLLQLRAQRSCAPLGPAPDPDPWVATASCRSSGPASLGPAPDPLVAPDPWVLRATSLRRSPL